MDLKEEILKETDKLFCQYGIKNVTMDEIAKHLGISKKTIYQHYHDKSNLVLMLIKKKMEAQVCVMDQNSSEASDAIDEVLRAVTHIQSLLTGICPAFFSDLQKYYPQAWLVFKTFRENSLFKVIRHNLGWGVQEGYYRKDINLDIISRMRIEQIDMAFDHSLPMVSKYGVFQVMKEITEHYLYGICTPDGHKLINNYKLLVKSKR